MTTKIRLDTQVMWLLPGTSLNAPEGFLQNGQIVTSVASGNLTVALKTLAGTDASPTNPIYCRIGGVVRSITGALSATFNSWTNYLNTGSAELATKEVDIFLYLWYDSTSGTVKWIASRIPYATTIWDFVFTSTSEKWVLNIWFTGIVNSDPVVNIWRFNAILSGGAGYTWSLPATSVIINRPIYETRWLEWTPVYSGSGSMTVTGTIVSQKYQVIWNRVPYKIEQAWLTTWGTASTSIKITMPFTNTLFTCWSCVVNDAWYKGSIFQNQVSSILDVSNSVSLSNWWLGANREIYGSSVINI